MRRLWLVAFLLCASALQAETKNPWEERARQEAEWRDHGWFLIPHQSNYFFPLTYNTSPHGSSTSRPQYHEAKFQLSFKILMWDHGLGEKSHLYFGYTQLSMWQVYDRKRSAPFRDVNHEPEIFMSFDSGRPLGNFTLRQTDVGVVHQSNGVSDPDSRSWNRAYARFVFDHDAFALAVKPWVRLPDDGHDDNPDIMKFMGYGDVTLSYYLDNHVLSVMVRNNLRAPHNRGAIRVDYSFPMTHRIIGLAQYFNGYGESLLDYNRPNNRFSLGVALNDWR